MSGGMRGTSLLEVVAATAVLAIAGVVGVGAITGGLKAIGEAQRPISAVELARDLLEEVLSKPFDDPAPPDGEASRALFDDADDYHGYADETSGYSRTVCVVPVDVAVPDGGSDPCTATIARSAATLLRVQVEVSRDEESVTLAGLKAKSAAILPGTRTGLLYVPGSRRGGNSEHLDIDILDRLASPVTVEAITVFWEPDPDGKTVCFKEIWADHDRVAEGDPTFEEGERIGFPALTPFTLTSRTLHDFKLMHFREGAGGQGPAVHTDDLNFTILFHSVGGPTYQVDVGGWW